MEKPDWLPVDAGFLTLSDAEKVAFVGGVSLAFGLVSGATGDPDFFKATSSMCAHVRQNIVGADLEKVLDLLCPLLKAWDISVARRKDGDR